MMDQLESMIDYTKRRIFVCKVACLLCFVAALIAALVEMESHSIMLLVSATVLLICGFVNYRLIGVNKALLASMTEMRDMYMSAFR